MVSVKNLTNASKTVDMHIGSPATVLKLIGNSRDLSHRFEIKKLHSSCPNLHA
jgi:hypothetical protein